MALYKHAIDTWTFYRLVGKVAVVLKRAGSSFRDTDLNEAAGAADAARELNHEGSRRPVDW